MGHVPLLDELAVVAAISVVVMVVLARLKLPAVAGLLVAGALIGPYGFRLVRSIHAIEVLAEVGVVLLLFTIGLEFSLERLRHILRQVAVGGALQVGLTVLVVAILARLFGQSSSRALFYGFIFALSSTAIVLRALAERQELDAPHGRFIVGTMIFQDLCVVPMVLVVPLLGTSAPPGQALIATSIALGKAALVVAATIGVSRLVVPRVLMLGRREPQSGGIPPRDSGALYWHRLADFPRRAILGAGGISRWNGRGGYGNSGIGPWAT